MSLCVALSLTSSSSSNPPNRCLKELHISCRMVGTMFNAFCFACKKYFKTMSWYLYVVVPSWYVPKNLVNFTLDKIFLSIGNSNIKFSCPLILLCKHSSRDLVWPTRSAILIKSTCSSWLYKLHAHAGSNKSYINPSKITNSLFWSWQSLPSSVVLCFFTSDH